MAIELKKDEYKSIIFDSYNKLERIELLNLNTGDGSIRMAKYASKKAREESPSELLENRDFHTIKLLGEDLTVLQNMIYKYVSKLEEYKEGTEV